MRTSQGNGRKASALLRIQHLESTGDGDGGVIFQQQRLGRTPLPGNGEGGKETGGGTVVGRANSITHPPNHSVLRLWHPIEAKRKSHGSCRSMDPGECKVRTDSKKERQREGQKGGESEWKRKGGREDEKKSKAVGERLFVSNGWCSARLP